MRRLIQPSRANSLSAACDEILGRMRSSTCSTILESRPTPITPSSCTPATDKRRRRCQRHVPQQGCTTIWASLRRAQHVLASAHPPKPTQEVANTRHSLNSAPHAGELRASSMPEAPLVMSGRLACQAVTGRDGAVAAIYIQGAILHQDGQGSLHARVASTALASARNPIHCWRTCVGASGFRTGK